MTCQALEAHQKGVQAVGQLHTAMNQVGQSLTAGSGGSSERCSGSGPAPYSQEPSGTESDSRLWRLIRKVFRQWASSIQPGTKWDRV